MLLSRARLVCALALMALTLGSCSGAAPRADRGAPTGEQVTLQRAAGTTVDVVAVGDIACPPGSAPTATTCRQGDTAALAQTLQPDAVLALGDLQYESGSLSAFQGSYDESWGALRSITYPVPGNHEYRTAGASGYYSYFQGRPGSTPPGYYSVELGAWRAYMLNSTCGEVDCAAEREWLRSTMASQPARCTLFALHHPRFSSGEHGSQAFTRSFLRIGYRHRLDLALAGHDHHYERLRRMDPDGGADAARGAFHFVAGAGGKSHYDADPGIRGSHFRDDTRFGVLRLRLSPGKFGFAFKTIDGRTPDSGVRYCK